MLRWFGRDRAPENLPSFDEQRAVYSGMTTRELGETVLRLLVEGVRDNLIQSGSGDRALLQASATGAYLNYRLFSEQTRPESDADQDDGRPTPES